MPRSRRVATRGRVGVPQVRMLGVLYDVLLREGRRPGLREVGAALGVSVNAVFWHLEVLRAAGYVGRGGATRTRDAVSLLRWPDGGPFLGLGRPGVRWERPVGGRPTHLRSLEGMYEGVMRDGHRPTFRELMAAGGHTSPYTATRHLARLVSEGYLADGGGAYRGGRWSFVKWPDGEAFAGLERVR